MSRIETFPHDLHFFFNTPARLFTPDQVIQNAVGVFVGDAEVSFVGLSLDQVRRGRFLHDLFRYPDVPRQSPDLRFEEVAERIDRRRVVAVPGEVAEQPLRLVARAEGQGLEFGGEVEEHDHALARHHIAQPVRVAVTDLLDEPVDGRGNVDRERGDTELVDDELRVFQAFRTGGAIGHPDADDVVLAQCLSREKGGE